MWINFYENYKAEAYEAYDESGLTNIDLYKSINDIGWNYRLTVQVQQLKDFDYITKKMIEIDKGEIDKGE